MVIVEIDGRRQHRLRAQHWQTESAEFAQAQRRDR